MRERALSGPVIERLATHPEHTFPDEAAWMGHLQRLGIADLKVSPDPVRIATEGALWGAIKAHGLLPETVIVSDDAGQFLVGCHALCWVHAERLVHKLDTFTDHQRRMQQYQRALIWWFYRDLKAYRREPTRRRRAELRARFDRIFGRRTGFVVLDRLLARLHANKPELLRVLDRPEIPLHTNGSENDIRAQVTRRKVSGGTRSDTGPRLPGRLSRARQDLCQARSQLLGLSRGEARRPGAARDPVPTPTRPKSVQARLIATGFANSARPPAP